MEKIEFKDFPITDTPIDADNLNLLQNNVENGIEANDIAISNVATVESITGATLINGWVNFGGTYRKAGYYKDRGRVYLRGLIKSGTSGSIAFVLNTGYRPSQYIMLPITCQGNTHGYLDIDPNGNVIVNTSGTYSSLDGAHFDIK